MQLSFTKPALPKRGVLILLSANKKLPSIANALRKPTRTALDRALKTAHFEGKNSETVSVLSPGDGTFERIIVIGTGPAKDLNEVATNKIGSQIYKSLAEAKAKTGVVFADAPESETMSLEEMAARVAYGAHLRSYRFDKYKTKNKDKVPTVNKVSFAIENYIAARGLFGELESIASGIFLTRDLVSEPANVLYPEEFADRLKALEDDGVKVSILGEKELEKIGMGSLLAVGQGSSKESQVVIMEWMGAPEADSKPLAIVGKGVTFDTGGISIKPAAGMEMMKWDMGGAGTVSGLMKVLAARKAKVNVIGAVGLVENMPSGEAQRPGDVVTSLSGQTIEVINTDAEGRLVLCDVLWYVQETYEPALVIDLATLTGAILVSLANEYAGLFSNDDALSEQLLGAGKKVGEEVWRMPMGPAFDKMINSDIADMKNVGPRYGGSTTAAQFLERYIKKGTPWAHLDIAGMAWADNEKPGVPKGGSGYGVALLNRLIADHYE